MRDELIDFLLHEAETRKEPADPLPELSGAKFNTTLRSAVKEGKIRVRISDSNLTDDVVKLALHYDQNVIHLILEQAEKANALVFVRYTNNQTNEHFMISLLPQEITNLLRSKEIDIKFGYGFKITIDDIWLSKTLVSEMIKNPVSAIDAINYTYNKYWINHDPEYPPKQDTIVEDLINTFKMIKSTAISVDRALRPPQFKKGGPKKQKKPSS